MPSNSGRRTKILIAIPTLSAGGAERVASMLANNWATAEQEVLVVTFEAPATKPFYQFEGGVRVIPLDLVSVSRPRWRAIYHTMKRIRALRRIIRAERPDVIISFLTKMNVMTALAADGLGVPVIISERNNPFVQKFDPFWDLARAFAFPKAFAFVTMTEGAAAFFPANQRPRTHIIANPVSPIAIASKSHQGFNLTGVGRLDSQKRFDRLIDAFALIEKDFPDWRLVIWGEGKLRPALEAQVARLGLKDRISLPGLTRQHGGWIDTADVLALSSDHEGWANVLIEAQANGVPIVSVDCQFGPSEILNGGEFGLLAPREDIKAFAAALARMMGDPRLREMFAEKGKVRAQLYAPDAIQAQWCGLVADALAANARHRASPSAAPSNGMTAQ